MNDAKLSKKKIFVTVLTATFAVPIVIIAVLAVFVASMVASHNSELNKLENETKSLFEETNLLASQYDCHDVELRNTCYFQLDAKDTKVRSVLLSRGFVKDDTYGNGFKNGSLYIEGEDGSYSSFYVK